ncbi:MAG TPA: hypothetical protein VMZ91_11980 [Candidatus Paceibacterota bacterium]|nr:hypothetical protein [Candidatus Paceibacterota bacterium]
MTKKEIFLLTILTIGYMLLGIFIGISWEQNSLTYFTESVIFEGTQIDFENNELQGKDDCSERALILSYYLPFELTEDLQVKDCQEIEWLDNKFQKLYFQKRNNQ